MPAVDQCLLCYADTKNSICTPLQIRNKRGHQNDYFRGHIDLFDLCDILKVSVNAAENYQDPTVSLCSICETDVRDIKKMLCEIRDIKRKLSKMMTAVKTKLQESLQNSTLKDRQCQYKDIRHGILFDLSNILDFADTHHTSFCQLKDETFGSFSGLENCDYYNYTENEFENKNGIIKINTPMEMTLENSEIHRRENWAAKNKISVSGSVETDGFDNEFDSDGEQRSSSRNDSSDPEFFESISSGNSEESDDDDNTNVPKWKSPMKNSSAKREQVEITVEAAQNSDSIEGQENFQRPLQQISGKVHGDVRKNNDNYKEKITCEICGSVLLRYGLRRHMREVHDGNIKHLNLKCKECGKVYKSNSSYKSHLRTHSDNFTPHVCSHCGKTLLTESALSVHEKKHVEGKKFTCDICHKMWYTISDLKEHMLSHSTERKNVCGTCGKQYKFRSHLSVHIKETHMEADNEIHECKQCGKQYKSKLKLKKHNAIYHPQVKTIHQCTVCGRIMTRKDHLKAHLKTHLKASISQT